MLHDEQFDRSSLIALRNHVTACGAAQGLELVRLTWFTLAAHEIAVNAVRHGGGRGRLRLWRTGNILRCLVSDDGPGIPDRYRSLRPHPPGVDAWSSSHGLWLARQFCSHMQITDRAGGGTDVLLEFPVPAHSESSTRPSDVRQGSAAPSARQAACPHGSGR
jgi:serine/threonine-protein kinase RsbW